MMLLMQLSYCLRWGAIRQTCGSTGDGAGLTGVFEPGFRGDGRGSVRPWERRGGMLVPERRMLQVS